MFGPNTSNHFATTHLTRIYGGGGGGGATTSKKNINKENANVLPSKTPSRVGGGVGSSKLGGGIGVGGEIGTMGRKGLGAKTEGRDRNVLGGQGGMGGEKGKGKEGEDIGMSLRLSDCLPEHTFMISIFQTLKRMTNSKRLYTFISV